MVIGPTAVSQVFQPQFVKPRPLPAGTSHLSGEVSGCTQQFLQYHRPHLVRTGACGHLDCFEVKTAAFAQPGEDDFQKRRYFLRDLTLDRFRRFFSCADSESLPPGVSGCEIFCLTI